ncbi:MAG: DUF5011 domain-containing protein [Bacteroidetes bacterium]|nr:DUF5011 domain-containing protein [Bacteroidota bacterium]
MKNIVITALAGLVLITACKKKESTTKVVNVPKMELIGTAVYSTPVGTGTYSDPGAKLIDENGNTTVLTTPTSSNVDLTTPGFYSATYSKRTEYGYNVSISRLVLVTPVSSAIDYSGVYTRTSNGQTMNVTKLGTGLYTTDNVGGVAGNTAYIFPVYFGMVNDTDIVVPDQPNPLGDDIYCTNSKLTVSGPDTTIQWVVMGAGFGTSLRKFIK